MNVTKIVRPEVATLPDAGLFAWKRTVPESVVNVVSEVTKSVVHVKNKIGVNALRKNAQRACRFEIPKTLLKRRSKKYLFGFTLKTAQMYKPIQFIMLNGWISAGMLRRSNPDLVVTFLGTGWQHQDVVSSAVELLV